MIHPIWKMIIVDLFSIQLTCCGILISIFTLIYSLVYGKINELRIISEEIKKGNQSPTSLQRERFCHNYINKYRILNKYIIFLGTISLVLCITAFVLKFFELSLALKCIFLSINIIDLLFIIFCIYRFIYIYHSTSKIN